MDNTFHDSNDLYHSLFSQKQNTMPFTGQSRRKPQIPEYLQEDLPETQIFKSLFQRLPECLRLLIFDYGAVILLVFLVMMLGFIASSMVVR